MAEDDFRDFLDGINDTADYIKYASYAQMIFVLALLIVNWAYLFVIVPSIFLLLKSKTLSGMLEEFDVSMIKNQTHIAEAAVDEALSCTYIINILSIVSILISIGITSYAMRSSEWALAGALPIIIYFVFVILCQNYATELKKLQFAISNYNQFK